MSWTSSRHSFSPPLQYLASPYFASMRASSVASSPRLAGSSGAGADTPSLSSPIVRFEAGLIGCPSNFFASATALLTRTSWGRAYSAIRDAMFTVCP